MLVAALPGPRHPPPASGSRDAVSEEVRAGRATSGPDTGVRARLLYHPSIAFLLGRWLLPQRALGPIPYQKVEPGEGFEPPTRALRKRSLASANVHRHPHHIYSCPPKATPGQHRPPSWLSTWLSKRLFYGAERATCILAAASACMLGMTCEYVSRVRLTVLWPSIS